MRKLLSVVVAVQALLLVVDAQGPPLAPASRPADVRFAMHLVDSTWTESAAVADLDNDRRPDIISGEYWYEAPSWTPHKIRDINFTGAYVDNFSDLPLDVDGDGYTDLIQIAYFGRRIVWMKNPGRTKMPWVEHEIDAIGPTEFAFLVDLDNDGKADELLPQFTTAGQTGITWYEVQSGKWTKHVISPQSMGHGIGVGDVNGDKRNDVLTPRGWLEAPADVRAPGEWVMHEAGWEQYQIPSPANLPQPPAARGGAATPPANEPPGGAAQRPPARNAEYGFMYVIDVNKDGRGDVLTTMAHSYGVLWIEQLADGKWGPPRVIDNTWAQAHASAVADINRDGQPDLVTGKRFFGRTGFTDPSEREPLGLYWYEWRIRAPAPAQPGAASRPPGAPAPQPAIEWIKHFIDYGGRAGGGLQIVVADIGADGDLDVVSGGKTGLFLAENMTSGARR